MVSSSLQRPTHGRSQRAQRLVHRFRPTLRVLRNTALTASCALLSFGCDSEGEPSTVVRALRKGVGSAAGGVVAEIDLRDGVSEGMASFNLFAPNAPPTFAETLQALKEARDDAKTRGVFLRIGTANVDFAQAHELGRLLSGVRAELPVICHAHAYTNATALLAAQACSEIWLSPAGQVDTVGIAGQSLYFKGLLDRLHVKADFLHMGRYKAAAEGVTREGPSPEAEQALTSVLGSIRTTWLDTLSAARDKPGVRNAAEDGPWSPEAALEQGLIDHVGYASEALSAAKKKAGVDEVETTLSRKERRQAGLEISEVLRFLSGTSKGADQGKHILVIPTAGAITMGGGGGFGGQDGIAASSLNKILKRVRKDKAVQAVVLRIDSPGGSALASDLIWHELMQLREEKPLIASLAGTAASGGYYMACAAHRIVSEPTTVLGSIGVVGGKIVIGDALGQLGITRATFPASPGTADRATYQSALTPWDDATRERVRDQMQSVYHLFLNRVAIGRGVDVSRIEPIAEGRIWSGTQGLENGLVDELGGLDEAIEAARIRAELSQDIPVRIEGGPETLIELLALDEDSDEEAIALALTRFAAREPQLWAEVTASLRPYLSGLTSLGTNERVLALPPYAWEVR